MRNAARFVAERHGLTVVEARVPWPLPGPEALVEAYAQALAGGARLAIVDHVFAPLAVEEAGSEEAARRWRRRLLDEHRIEVLLFAMHGRLWLRFSAQGYNELSDYEALAGVFG